jgi:hypothetical protein
VDRLGEEARLLLDLQLSAMRAQRAELVSLRDELRASLDVLQLAAFVDVTSRIHAHAQLYDAYLERACSSIDEGVSTQNALQRGDDAGQQAPLGKRPMRPRALRAAPGRRYVPRWMIGPCAT